MIIGYVTAKLGQTWVEKRGRRRLVQIIGFGQKPWRPFPLGGEPTTKLRNVDTGKETEILSYTLGERFEFVR